MSLRLKSKKSFGLFVRSLKIKHGIGQRELAQKIGIAASYLNDIEKNPQIISLVRSIKNKNL